MTLISNMITNDVWRYSWNGENRMTSATNTQDGTYITYDYDYQGRMVQKVVNNETNSFVWMGNHIIAELIANDSQLTTNCYTWAGGETLTASLNGNMITNDTWRYTWNGENRMVSATNSTTGAYITYDYDFKGRNVRKVVNGDETIFIWHGNHIIAELTDSETNTYCWLNGETLTASLDGETVFYCHDANKNVTDLVDDSGGSVAHYEYSPFGVITEQSGSLDSENIFRFSNEVFDDDLHKIVYLYRIYDPWLNKFLSRDPIGEDGGLNLYGINGNDCINSWDEWGLKDNGKVLVVTFWSNEDGSSVTYSTKTMGQLLNSIHHNLFFAFKKEKMPSDKETGEQDDKKWDNKCWKKVYFVEGLIGPSYASGTGGQFEAKVDEDDWIDLGQKAALYEPEEIAILLDMEHMFPFIATHETLHACRCRPSKYLFWKSRKAIYYG